MESFKTRKGYCHFNEDAIVISKSRNPEKPDFMGRYFFVVFFGVLGITSLYFGFKFIVNSNETISAEVAKDLNEKVVGADKIAYFYFFAAVLLLANALLFYFKSKDKIINYQDISTYKYRAPEKFSYAYFKVQHEDKIENVVPLSKIGKESEHVKKAKKLFKKYL